MSTRLQPASCDGADDEGNYCTAVERIVLPAAAHSISLRRRRGTFEEVANRGHRPRRRMRSAPVGECAKSANDGGARDGPAPALSSLRSANHRRRTTMMTKKAMK